MTQEYHAEMNAAALREQHATAEVRAECAGRVTPNHDYQQTSARAQYNETQAELRSTAKLVEIEENAMKDQVSESAMFSRFRYASEQNESLLRQEVFSKTEGLQLSHDEMVQHSRVASQELAQERLANQGLARGNYVWSQETAVAKSECLEALQHSQHFLGEYNQAMRDEQAEHSEACELWSQLQYMQQALPPGLPIGQPASSSSQTADAALPGPSGVAPPGPSGREPHQGYQADLADASARTGARPSPFGDPTWNAPAGAESASNQEYAERQRALFLHKSPPPVLPPSLARDDPDDPVLKTKEGDKVIVPHYPAITTLLAWQTSLLAAVVTTSGEREYTLVARWIGQAYAKT